MKIKYWYAWLSIPSFIVLWLVTIFQLNLRSLIKTTYGLNLWLRCIGEFFFCMGIIMIPTILLSVVFDELGISASEVAIVASNFVFYLLGVYAAFRFAKWREENKIGKKEDVL